MAGTRQPVPQLVREALLVKLGYRVTGTCLKPLALLAGSITKEGIYSGNEENRHDRGQDNSTRLDHSVTIEAVRGRKVTIIAQAPDGEHIHIVSASDKPGQQDSSESTERPRKPCDRRVLMNRNEVIG